MLKEDILRILNESLLSGNSEIREIIERLEKCNIIEPDGRIDFIRVGIQKIGKNKARCYWRSGNKRMYGQTVDIADIDRMRLATENRLNSGIRGIPDMPWEVMRAEFVKDRGPDVKIFSNEATEIALGHFERLCGKPSSHAITQDLIAKFRVLRCKDTYRRGENGEDRKLSKFTMNKNFTEISTFLHWAHKKGYLKERISVAKVRTPEIEPRVLTDKERTALLEQAARYPDMMLRLKLQLATARRMGDIEKLPLANIDFENNTVKFWEEKTGKFHKIPLKPNLMTELAKWIETLSTGQKWLFHKDNPTNKKLSSIFPTTVWKTIRRRAGLSDISTHDLRRTILTWVLDKYGLGAAMQLSGHSDPKTLTKHYINSGDALARAYNDMPE